MTADQLDCDQPSPFLLPTFKMLNGVSNGTFAFVKIIEWHAKWCKQRKTVDICAFKIRMFIYDYDVYDYISGLSGNLCRGLPLLMVPNLAR